MWPVCTTSQTFTFAELWLQCLLFHGSVVKSFPFYWTPLRNRVQGLQLSAFSLLLLMDIVDITLDTVALPCIVLHIHKDVIFCRDRSMSSVCFFLNAFPCVFWACILLGIITVLPGMHQTKHFLSFPPFIPHLLSIPMLLLSYSPSGSLITKLYSS